jgi:hypothetical protein
MQRWTTDPPLHLPLPFEAIRRLDLEFEDVRRDAGSFTAYVFVNPDGEVPDDAGRTHPSFAGSFSVFAPTTCWGSDGHCDWERGPVSAFDRRPPHHLTPINVSMDISQALKRLGDPEELVVTAHAVRRAEPQASEGVLRFARLTAFAYE